MANRRYKRIVVEKDKLDGLTDLPINVINLIQECVDFDDAIKMSTMSSN